MRVYAMCLHACYACACGLAVGATLGMQAFPGLSLSAYSVFLFFNELCFFYSFCLEFSFRVGVLGLGF